MTGPHIFIVSRSYPFGIGEDFLAQEIDVWSRIYPGGVTLLPLTTDGESRVVPETIRVDCTLAKSVRKYQGVISYLHWRTLNLFASEVFRSKSLALRKVLHTFQAAKKFNGFRRAISTVLQARNQPECVIYTYWLDEVTYALASLREEGYVFGLVSRAHGSDVYRERRFSNSFPFRSRYISLVDKVCCVSSYGLNYLQNEYQHINNLVLSRLGVVTPPVRSPASGDSCFNILSCSSLRRVKRVDRIVRLVSAVARELPMVSVRWVHIGSGKLRDQLEVIAHAELSGINNLFYEFKGLFANQQVHDYFRGNAVDVFVNTSDSEGLPVSVMEAQSYGVPVVATDVGGTGEIIQDGVNGFLVSMPYNDEQAVSRLMQMSFFKAERVRKMSLECHRKLTSAESNFRDFIELILDAGCPRRELPEPMLR